jgi:hypothetical protein
MVFVDRRAPQGGAMARRVTMAVAAALLLSTASADPAGATTSLLVPQSIAFSVLGHSCGGIQEHAFATGFDSVSGYPTGAVYLQTRCGGSGRGGGYHVTTYAAWTGVTWDYTGAVVSYVALPSAPAVDPTFSAFDQYGNEVYNQSNVAYLVLAAGFVPTPRVTSVSPIIGPASGGTALVIIGTGFTAATGVQLGGTDAATFTVNGDTSISAVTPATSPGIVDVTVLSAGGTSATGPSDQFTFVGAPSVSRLDPNSGPVSGGTAVTITGTNFTHATAVNFGDMPAGFTVNDYSSITAVSPFGEAVDTVDVRVVSIGGTSPIVAADQFAYTPPVCGDGTISFPELCDDGAANGTASSCCTVTCTFVSAGTPCTEGACDGAGTCVPRDSSNCGNAVVEAGEQCDDGAALNGRTASCCSINCHFQPSGTACTDDGNICTADLCDGKGVCTHPALPCGSNTTTTSTSTTSTLSGATPTTLPCTTPRCTVDAALRGPECGDEVVPPSIVRHLDRAMSLIAQAASSPPKKASRLLTHARHVLQLAGNAAEKAATGKKPALTKGCAMAIRRAAGGARGGLQS